MKNVSIISIITLTMIATSHAKPISKIESMSCGYQGAEISASKKKDFKQSLTAAADLCKGAGNQDAEKKYRQQAKNCGQGGKSINGKIESGHDCSGDYDALKQNWCGYQKNPVHAATTSPSDEDLWHMRQALEISEIQCGDGANQGNMEPGSWDYFYPSNADGSGRTPVVTFACGGQGFDCRDERCVLSQPFVSPYPKVTGFDARKCTAMYKAISKPNSPY